MDYRRLLQFLLQPVMWCQKGSSIPHSRYHLTAVDLISCRRLRETVLLVRPQTLIIKYNITLLSMDLRADKADLLVTRVDFCQHRMYLSANRVDLLVDMTCRCSSERREESVYQNYY